MIEVAGKLVAVVGLGKSGLAAAELLRDRGASVVAIDSKPTDEMRERLNAIGAELLPHEEASFAGAQLIVQSPGVPLESIPSTHVPIIGELELAGYYMRGPIMGITGSNGKTTTTSLIGHILQHSGIPCQVGGNIGVPPTAMVSTSRADQWNVLELSSFQLETVREFKAKVAVVLNVTQNHLDRHGSMERYTAAKARLVETQDRSCYAVLNKDNAIVAGFAKKTRSHVVWVGAHSIKDGAIYRGTAKVMDITEIPLRGMHNVENVVAAAAATRLAGATAAQIREAVMSFAGVEHRLEFVRKVNGVDYYNDSKATSVDATLKAVEAFPGKLWIILGGKDKGSDYTPLREPLAAKAHAALLVGAAAEKIGSQLEGALECIPCGDLQHAVELASSRATAGDTVLLAPACASFDQFRSFEHRGEVFKDLVRRLG